MEEMSDLGHSAGSASPPPVPLPDDQDDHQSPPPGPKRAKKRIRKPRGRGLRTKTGCLTCRKRHKKCDEQFPVCSHCVTSNRECVWPEPGLPEIPSGNSSVAQSPSGSAELRSLPAGIPPTSHSAAVVVAQSQQQQHQRQFDQPSLTSTASNSPQRSSPAAALSPDAVSVEAKAEARAARPTCPPLGPVAPTLDYHFPNGPTAYSHNIVDPALAALFPGTRPKPTITDLVQSSHGHQPASPETMSSADGISVGTAGSKWLDLLAGDAAAQAAGGFNLGACKALQTGSRSRAPTSPASEFWRGTPRDDGLRISNSRTGVMGRLDWSIPERYPWQEDANIELNPLETLLFRAFAERSALWMDLFDPYKHFSTCSIRLALRNFGLIKAILALQARHASVASDLKVQPKPGSVPEVDPTVAVQYYHEALCYVSRALQYQSYARSEEILCTAMVISTYEMLDAHMGHGIGRLSPGQRRSVLSNWQRHLKGIFWIQRSQGVNGASGGLRQAVWWAWLRQDLWAAFREHRRCLSFWRPVIDYSDLTQCELADRSIYLLSQAVNYCADDPEIGSWIDAGATSALADESDEAVRRRCDRGAELMEMLERWKSFIGDGFQPLPTGARPLGAGVGVAAAKVWKPVWIHPPDFGVALQAYHFARILVCLHWPAVGGGRYDDTKTQGILAEAVEAICGIAMEMTDHGCQLMSARCLFGAGLCVQTAAQQEGILELMEACEARSGWPLDAMRDDLRAEWRKRDTEMHDV
ncbi:hypothetical protein GGTG_05803 [Gaeumannomyces tritici R3-111a-1]|uniref:Zn(2)-C6 fungal-type domain-containing protein n=1 Tax=Gaeumannomyces tritici (strain R3-111a-1) TaxID=644352 RepID=J3NWZ2_GAET3|nr:hypothetical protein GGTG_05803 [Gaeumannomyces tritici R3-111a-1]EJT75874.1 hypothetical protein GGTG_05803 [Gaeumannomyces tritici R3-111a-1]